VQVVACDLRSLRSRAATTASRVRLNIVSSSSEAQVREFGIFYFAEERSGR